MPDFSLTRDQEETLLREAMQEAQCGMAEGEVPIGAVIALYEEGNARIVARGHNQGNKLQRKNAHAEIRAFENAGSDGIRPAALPLDAKNIILVSNLEPCVMCLGAAMEAGVDLILFGLEAPADNGTQRVKPPESPESKSPEIKGGILAEQCRDQFETWLHGNEDTEQAKFVTQLLALTPHRA